MRGQIAACSGNGRLFFGGGAEALRRSVRARSLRCSGALERGFCCFIAQAEVLLKGWEVSRMEENWKSIIFVEGAVQFDFAHQASARTQRDRGAPARARL